MAKRAQAFLARARHLSLILFTLYRPLGMTILHRWRKNGDWRNIVRRDLYGLGHMDFCKTFIWRLVRGGTPSRVATSSKF